MGEQSRNDFKQFKDPVYGYIPVQREYVKHLIDTKLMQRIKGVAQSGLRPVFSSATHDRFSHSLGVYKFGVEMFDSLFSKFQTDPDVKSYLEQQQSTGEPFSEMLDKWQKHWKTLLSIACLLHDIGHPVQSHGFEFLYDDPYLDVACNGEDIVKIGNLMGSNETNRVHSILIDFADDSEKTPEGNLSKALLNSFQDHGDIQSKAPDARVPGKPHERMSAYYILNDTELKSSVEELIRVSRCSNFTLESNESTVEGIKGDLCFIARMIIGWEYPVEQRCTFDCNIFINSLKNCVIHILNGTLDADGIDYLMRNSYAAGYDTSRVDSVRLCSAYTFYIKGNVAYPAFSKSVLSVLEGYMAARDFEPKWLYSHHKVVYADLLTKQIYKYTTRYLTDKIMLAWSLSLFCKNAPFSSICCGDNQDLGNELLLLPQEGSISLDISRLRSHIEQWSYPFYTYLLAPCKRYDIGYQYFYRSADSDIDALFHRVASELMQYHGRNGYDRFCADLRSQAVCKALKNLPPDSESQRALRILLAENCLHILKSKNDKNRRILMLWIESGDAKAALSEAQKTMIEIPSALENLLTRVQTATSTKEMLDFWLNSYRPLLSKGDFEDFIHLLDEYQSRCYRKSLWKSEPEYSLFLTSCARELGCPANDVYRYMEALIVDGMEQHGFSIFDGKAAMPIPSLYREQFYYIPLVHSSGESPRGKINKFLIDSVREDSTQKRKDIVQKWGNLIFAKKEKYDFSRGNLVVRFYRAKTKRFGEIDLLFGKQVVPLEDVFPYHKHTSMLPYFYYNLETNSSSNDILGAFREDFIAFCREYREAEVKSEVAGVQSSHVFRDAVYGDIEMSDDFYAVVCTREFQRLGRIRQLAVADRRFTGATHTRLAHSIGTWYVMRLILNHFDELYRDNTYLGFNECDRNYALLAALLHDVGHGPYSHMMEDVFDTKHEEMTCAIISDPNTELYQIIEQHFGPGAVQRVCELLDSDGDPRDLKGIALIYRSLISGQLDADRIDYLLRDNVACGMAFGHIDIQQVIASMRLFPYYRNSCSSYRLCFDDRYLPAIEQFIYARYQMYRNVYHEPNKLLFEQIFKQLFKQVDQMLENATSHPTLKILKQLRRGQICPVRDYIRLDDESIDALLQFWASGHVLADDVESAELMSRAKLIELLSQTFLYQKPLFERIDLGEHRRNYDLLAKNVSRMLGKECNTFSSLESCAFIFIQGTNSAYTASNDSLLTNKGIILRNMEDGTIRDYALSSLFRSIQGTEMKTVLETDYTHLFFSVELLKEECAMRGLTDETVKTIVSAIESAKPRRHIEIEKKFYCSHEQLNLAKQYLDKQHPGVASIKEQTDTYYDWNREDGSLVLYSNHFSFRCRKKENIYVFTVKIPTNSQNYHSPSQFARYEHEFIASSPRITEDVWNFFLDTLAICEKSALCANLRRENLKPLLIVQNQRTTYHINNKYEICLDMVDYFTPNNNPIGQQDYQVEVELLGEPEAWSVLEDKVISPLVAQLGEDTLNYTEQSKLEKGISYLFDASFPGMGALQNSAR